MVGEVVVQRLQMTFRHKFCREQCMDKRAITKRCNGAKGSTHCCGCCDACDAVTCVLVALLSSPRSGVQPSAACSVGVNSD